MPSAMTASRESVSVSEVAAALSVMAAVTDAIRQLGRVPAGTMYAMLMDKMDHAGFEKMVGLIVGTGLVRREGDALVWVGE